MILDNGGVHDCGQFFLGGYLDLNTIKKLSTHICYENINFRINFYTAAFWRALASFSSPLTTPLVRDVSITAPFGNLFVRDPGLFINSQSITVVISK